MNITVINVNLPFIEAIEHLNNDKDVIGCVCLNDTRPCIIALNENKELKIIEENFLQKYEKTFDELTSRLLSLDNILKHQWQLVYKIMD